MHAPMDFVAAFRTLRFAYGGPLGPVMCVLPNCNPLLPNSVTSKPAHALVSFAQVAEELLPFLL